MARNIAASKRGFGYDPVTRSLGIYVDGALAASFPPTPGRTYFVNNITGASTNDGLSWANAFDEVDNAITAAEAYRDTFGSTNQYIRCAIIIQATGTDNEAVDTADCNYNDFIGLGADPQGDGVGIARITGANAADAWNFSATTRGNSWYNLQFDASGTAYYAFDGAAMLRSRWEECAFMGDAHYNEALVAAFRASGDFGGNTIYRCRFGSNWASPTIGLRFDGEMSNSRIEECIIEAATYGIYIPSDTLTSGGMIRGNVIRAATYGIHSASAQSLLWIVGNWISSADAIHIVAGGTTNGEHMVLGNHVNDAGTVVLFETAAG